MKHAAIVALFMFFLPFAPLAAEVKAGDIRVTQPWSRALPPMAANGAVYFSMTNTGRLPDRLIGGSTPIAERAELHTHVMDGDMMRMRQVPAIEVKPGDKTVLEPGGLHLMLLGLIEPLEAGKRFPLMLEFERSGTVHVEVEAQAAEASAPTHGSHQQHAGQPTHGGDSEHKQNKRTEVDAATAPTLALSLESLEGGDWNLHLATTRFRFAPDHVDQPHVAGEGHAHLYVDGKKIGRIYGSPERIQALAPGVHEIKVGLFTNDHAAYVADGREIAERFIVLVEKPGRKRGQSERVRRFDLSISHGSVADDKKRIRVTQGDTVELRWMSDAPQVLHLHGYDIEADVTPHSPLVMRFVASATGRFAVETHGQSHGGSHGHGALMHLEVYPE